MKNNKNKVVRAIILNKEGKVLLGKRTQGRGAGGWALVVGKPEENETPEATIVREAEEELGIKFNPHFYFEETDKEPFPGEFWDVVYFQGYFAGEIMLNDENSEVKFISFDDLENLEIAFDHKEILTRFFKQRKS